MRIEEVLKQTTPFQSESQKLIVNLMYTHGWLKEKMTAFFKEFDLTSKQYNILRILRGAKKPVSTSFIRSRMVDRMSDTSRIIDRMIIKDLVEKQVCPIDKRLIDITLSDLGRKKLELIDARIGELDQLFSGLSHDELGTLNELLDKSRITNH